MQIIDNIVTNHYYDSVEVTNLNKIILKYTYQSFKFYVIYLLYLNARLKPIC